MILIRVYLSLKLHAKKRFIGKSKTGIEFLGYKLKPGKKVTASATSLLRFRMKARRLYERELCLGKVWRYITRWVRWLWGGLSGLVSLKGGSKRYFYYIYKNLQLKGLAAPPMNLSTLK